MTTCWRGLLPSRLRKPKGRQTAKPTEPKVNKIKETKSFIVQTISFFDLPREIRDQIYHYYWSYNPKHVAPRTPFHPITVRLNYNERPDITKEFYVETQRFPSWLLASKQLKHEALQQYTTRAEWSAATNIEQKPLKPDNRFLSSALDMQRVTRLTLTMLCVSAAATNANHPVYQDLRRFAEVLAKHQEHPKTMAKIQQLRILGYTYVSILPETPGMSPKSHVPMTSIAEGVAGRIANIFASAELKSLEFALHQESDCYRRWVVWQITGRGKDVGIRVIDDQKHEWPMEGWMMDSFDYHPTYPV